ncbi:alpha-hydroxy-acid oxidizing protein [Pseudomonas sp. gcc21]|uniref:alpha-hydroxy acid oxidase n=1 Tax=Pseudomonas sp. gcc21 TaxID=2726989 RepID=UPI0014527729|nr:alpha-hydroxy acid oxidase [Pseudomonas sp. gcc21]QJD58134.1 alpha-hydroxy-acid oxidizing protein [Pseudomonas sp. gcc21]
MTVHPPLEQIPADILAAADYEDRAAQHIPPPTLAWLAGGSGTEQTLRANREAFITVRITPRLLNNFQTASTCQSLCGTSLEHPILLAPVGHQQLLHTEAERAVARAADATGTCMVASTLSSLPLEDVCAATAASKWFQLYWQPRREDTLRLLSRAEAAGYQAIVLTLDTPVQALSRRAHIAGFRLPSDTPPNLAECKPLPQRALAPGQSILLHGMMSEAPDWDDLEWLVTQTRLPVLAKGVSHPADAVRLKTLGVAGQIVSNHGGRSLDGVPASLHCLAAVREAVGGNYPLLLDSGIRSGTDVFKALALGADAVLIGRLQGYALATAGALGVAHMLKLLREELEVCMALAGTPTLSDINPGCLMGD